MRAICVALAIHPSRVLSSTSPVPVKSCAWKFCVPLQLWLTLLWRNVKALVYASELRTRFRLPLSALPGFRFGVIIPREWHALTVFRLVLWTLRFIARRMILQTFKQAGCRIVLFQERLTPSYPSGLPHML